ncbi:MAG: c-type cytochrome [Candidatus Binatia bacterium]|nr:c-type cytochrome [Candidatus Binatia bacterium]
MKLCLILVMVAGLVGGCTKPAPNLGSAGDPARGRSIAAIAGGCGCHTPEKGPVGAGGVEIETPFGLFYSTNITSDTKAGIGDWTDPEIEGALRRGILRDGSVESPVMPYYRYAGMADQDVRDLIAWLRTLPASSEVNRPADVSLPLPRLAFWGWRTLFASGVTAPATAPAAGVERGEYLVQSVAICGDCHTPRDVLGRADEALYLAGSKDGPLGGVPNITPDQKTGVGDWDESDMVALLQDGMQPDMDNVQGKMADVVDGIAGGPGYFDAPEADFTAIAAYLKTVPPIFHDVGD